MTKTGILQQIQDAKTAHIRWVKRADHLVSGLPVDKDFIPLESTTCAFGQWFYHDGVKLRLVPSIDNLMSLLRTKRKPKPISNISNALPRSCWQFWIFLRRRSKHLPMKILKTYSSHAPL